jgi:hypothetical protein
VEVAGSLQLSITLEQRGFGPGFPLPRVSKAMT